MSRLSRRSFFAGLLGPLAGWFVGRATGSETRAVPPRSITCTLSHQVTVYSYDGSGRLTTFEYSPSNDVSVVGTLTNYTADGKVTTFTYNGR